MRIYAGIDEAGYGPLFGPLVIGRTVFGLADDAACAASKPRGTLHSAATGDQPRALPCLWKPLRDVVCKTIAGNRGRIAVNDSKKLHNPAAGVRHLEMGALAFGALAGCQPGHVGQWLDGLGETSHNALDALPWYCPTDDWAWDALPRCFSAGELAIARSMLKAAAKREGISVLDVGGAVVFEDRFNQMTSATRSKAATSFTFVAGHLRAIWQRFAEQGADVAVDRQSGRMRYRELLSLNFPEATVRVLEESPTLSVYRMSAPAQQREPARQMTVRFEVDADAVHLPVALASMISKYTRELLMARFQAWFTRRAAPIKPTAGYGSDGKRFWQQIEPMLADLAIQPRQLKRMC